MIGEDFDREKLKNLVELYKIRARTLKDFNDHLKVYYQDVSEFDEKGVSKHMKKEGTKALLENWSGRLSSIEGFDHSSLEEACRACSEELGVKAARLIHPTRVAISGRTTGAGIFEMMEVMGKDTVLKRLDYAIKNLAQ